MTQNGKLIAFSGLPSSGKSTTCFALSKLLKCRFFNEPEEKQWPQIIADRGIYGNFTALTWFRSVRVPMIIDAHNIREQGGTAIVDSYYDVLLRNYIRSEAFQWLIPQEDAYFSAAIEMAEADYQQLPVPDVLIFLRLEQSVWNKMMTQRGRQFDTDANLQEFFAMQDAMEAACRKYELERRAKLLIVDQYWSDPETIAVEIAQQLPALND